MKRAAAGAASRGFSLVEVMVAVIVICVGMLGIAKLEALSVSNTTTARLRSLAAIEAASLAAAKHTNRQYWAKTDRKSTRLNSSHSQISYAVFCLKKKKKTYENTSIGSS